MIHEWLYMFSLPPPLPLHWLVLGVAVPVDNALGDKSWKQLRSYFKYPLASALYREMIFDGR